MQTIKLTKISEAESPLHPGNIAEGHEVFGQIMDSEPRVGQNFWVTKNTGGYFKTSIVQEVIDENTFRTHNSIYQIERL